MSVEMERIKRAQTVAINEEENVRLSIEQEIGDMINEAVGTHKLNYGKDYDVVVSQIEGGYNVTLKEL